ncbi:Uncharacterised protein [Raoultella planticola]|uniref:Uncharacterized protein n=1 Tax=Raoultella planticola TaxID=575 RepID=A0A485CH47_RAOPL|nr:Uncharacterised protein [Raoultella planticola]
MRYIPGRIPAILAVSNLFFTCAVSVDLTIATLVGYQLAPSDELATVPFALITVAGAFSSLFAAGMIGRGNEKLAFILGSVCGTAGGLLSFLAVLKGSFLLFCTGCFLVGVYQAFSQYYRLVAADHTPAGSEGAVYLSGHDWRCCGGNPRATVDDYCTGCSRATSLCRCLSRGGGTGYYVGT